MNMKHLMRYLIIAALLPLLTACDHKDLCFDHPQHAARYATRVNIDYEREWEQPYKGLTDWGAQWPSLGLNMSYDNLRPSVPEGIRMLAYSASGMRTEVNMVPQGEEMHLPPGDNSILFFNNDTEYIIFSHIDSYEKASATTRSRSRKSFNGNPHYMPASRNNEPEVTVSAPDMLFGHYISRYTQTIVTTPPELDITMHPLVFTYVVRYRFEYGYSYVALARGALSGMAAAVYLHNGRTSKEAVTILYDCELKPWGIEAIVKTFGIPDFPNPSYSRSDGSYAINLEVRLSNGKIKNFFFDITEQVAAQPHGGVITVDGIKITDQEAGGTEGSGFDVDVDGWGEFQDVTIDF